MLIPPTVQNAYRKDCCPPPCAVPPEYMCFMPDIYKQYWDLVRRHSKTSTKRWRIRCLAEPKHRSEKFQPTCICPEVAYRKIEIVRCDQPVHTRTEQLAYPSVAKLMGLQAHPAFTNFENKRKKVVNCIMNKSLHSMYSRLGNARPPMKPRRIRKWTTSDWNEHKRRLVALSAPIKDWSVIEPEPILSKDPLKKPKTSNIRRVRKLARPKSSKTPPPKEDWHLSYAMKYYEPSKRILQMARPRVVVSEEELKPLGVSKKALKYSATPRIQELARPQHYRIRSESQDGKINPFRPTPQALRAKATPRIEQIAQPKDYYDSHTRANPFKVSPRALRAKPTRRLLELAIPKKRS